ncbi:ArsR/SmtB family transcription factor [Phytoactinopolyspora halotolerans]|uniref:Winged helix-turn-helix transcriptional regulator n=1 Tax=Phytoactinopolyspora halotolerans TaxID=1981512 RepID=A0A6L9SAH0_9ACTN|nr:metalloregulator ArsR/SmtB family transcription factor [Phytoactinopolyspora halotolerans]NEE01614.1 winged helix-turn-helix transcriptional regulator [Phytoactinopolyspora halotolerans]
MPMNPTVVGGVASRETDQAAVMLFHSLADPARLAIIRLLGDGERRVVDLTRDLGLAQSTVSGHLACLRSAGLIDAHPHGRSTYYALARPELWRMLAAAENVLDAGGSAVTLCPEHHRPESAEACGAAVRGCLHASGHAGTQARPRRH